MDPNIKLIVTDDGSHSLFHKQLNETYHSFHGAVQESRHVFIQMGLEHIKESSQEPLKILEVGMGTGLNVLLAAEWSSNHSVGIEFTTIEAYPIDIETATALNYCDYINHPDGQGWFNNIHSNPWNDQSSIHHHFELLKVQDLLEDHKLKKDTYDIIFFDAFAPNKQADLWEKDVLQKMYECQSNNGVFVTYCAKGQLKRDLSTLGYTVETLPGPPGKKEMVRGEKK